ncbi:hypothetical protein J3P77_16360 [Pseudomonas sp. R1-18]|uniref:hypothetical protein n=1 Tax=Pseudomonas sp. R1-18 TaxID=1632772 RepID=UPI003DA96F29
MLARRAFHEAFAICSSPSQLPVYRKCPLSFRTQPLFSASGWMDLWVIKQQACTKFRQIEKKREKLNLFLGSVGQFPVFAGFLLVAQLSAKGWLKQCLRYGWRSVVTGVRLFG